MSNNQGGSMFKVGETAFTKYGGHKWAGVISEIRHDGQMIIIDGMPKGSAVHVSACFRSDVSQAEAYARAEGIMPAARHKAAALRDEARELETQAEHLRRSAFEVERDAAAMAEAAIATAPR